MNAAIKRVSKQACRALGLISLLSLSACSIFAGEAQLPEKRAQVYSVASRRLAPEPVYNRIRLVYLPDVKPGSLADSNAPTLPMRARLSLKNNTLEQAGIALAAIGNYQAYTASSIAKQKLSLEAVGSLDELGAQLSMQSGAHVVIDHPHRQIRILKQGYAPAEVEPRFESSAMEGTLGS